MNIEQAISVSTLGNYLKQIIDAEEMLYRITVYGEVASFSVSGKSCYFTIKDDTAILNCVLFDVYPSGSSLIGKKVLVRGTPKYYVKGGRFSFQVESISPYGEGELNKRFLELKEKLTKEGLFDLERKKPMPTTIRKIGVVTSETGAVIQDIIDVATRRDPTINIVLYPVKVQGVGAEFDICKGITFFNDYDVDAVIVGRGGGSEEDLLPFNTEIVARSVANSNKFIVSAVGHETNYSLCDYASDLRAPTPSAAAELLVKERRESIEKVKNLFLSIQKNVQNLLFDKSNMMIDYVDGVVNILSNKLQECEHKLNNTFSNTCFAMQKYITSKENYLSILCNNIALNNPMKILTNGYAKVFKNDNIITQADQLKPDDDIVVMFKDGCVNATIKENV